MMRYLFAFVALAAGLGAAAAEEVKVDLKAFKFKCKFETTADLGGYDEGENRLYFYSFGTASGDVAIPEDGEYTVTVEASCNEAQKELAKFKLSVGDVVVAKEHLCTAEEAKKYTFTAKLKKGKQALAIEFLNDAYKDGEYDRNLFVYSVKVEKK